MYVVDKQPVALVLLWSHLDLDMCYTASYHLLLKTSLYISSNVVLIVTLECIF